MESSENYLSELFFIQVRNYCIFFSLTIIVKVKEDYWVNKFIV